VAHHQAGDDDGGQDEEDVERALQTGHLPVLRQIRPRDLM
jgi:hypothetical protein